MRAKLGSSEEHFLVFFFFFFFFFWDFFLIGTLSRDGFVFQLYLFFPMLGSIRCICRLPPRYTRVGCIFKIQKKKIFGIISKRFYKFSLPLSLQQSTKCFQNKQTYFQRALEVVPTLGECGKERSIHWSFCDRQLAYSDSSRKAIHFWIIFQNQAATLVNSAPQKKQKKKFFPLKMFSAKK